MRVRALQCKAFGLDAQVALPDVGVVVVTGRNGTGKSLLFVETVAAALWGKTLRGRAPWDDAATTEQKYQVAIDGYRVQRSRKGKGSPKLVWAIHDDGTPAARIANTVADLTGALKGGVHETTAKAQTDLEGVVGSFDVWRRTHVFSSADAAHFSTATDAERKRLVETVLGLDAFDVALAACRDDLRAAEQTRQRLAVRAASLVSQAAALEQALGRSKTAHTRLLAAAPGEPPALDDDALNAAQRALQACHQDSHRVERALADALRATGAADAEAKRAQRELAAWRADAACPTCKRPLPSGDRAALEKRVADAAAVVDREREAATDLVSALVEEKDEIADTKELLLQQVEDAKAAKQAHAAYARWWADMTAAEQQVRTDEVTLAGAESELREVEQQVQTAEADLSELRATEQVLGLRGVRARLLDGALAGLEQVANSYLLKLAPPALEVRISSTRTKKTGGEVDVLDVKLVGAGCGDYGGASAGQRRRIDLALLLGLAAVAGGNSSGTLFLDECLDGLDDDGVQAAADLLTDLAQTRCVVVLTHNKQLVGALDAVARYAVADGACKQVQR